MIRNYYYLIVGLLFILFAYTHTLNGVNNSLLHLFESNIEPNSKTTFQYIWHLIGIENLVFGGVLLIMAFIKEPSKVKFTAWTIITILIFRWIVITYFTVSSSDGSFQQILTDSIAILLVVVLLYFGTRVKEKESKKLR